MLPEHLLTQILMMTDEDDMDVKLADFNLSKILLGEDYTHTVLGTMGYCAPEVNPRHIACTFGASPH